MIHAVSSCVSSRLSRLPELGEPAPTPGVGAHGRGATRGGDSYVVRAFSTSPRATSRRDISARVRSVHVACASSCVVFRRMPRGSSEPEERGVEESGRGEGGGG